MNKEIEEAIRKCNLFIQAGATINLVDCNSKGQLVFKEYNTSAIETVLNYIKEIERENKELKGFFEGKEQATIDNSICKERMAEDALQKNVKLKKALVDSTPNSVIREKIEELKKEKEQLRIEKNVTWDSGIYKIDLKIQALEEILKEGEK